MISSYELDHELAPECSRFMQVDTIADDISQSRLHEAGQRGQAAGRTAEAIPLLERTLADCERVLGPGPPQPPDLPQQSRHGLPGRGADPPRLKPYEFVAADPPLGSLGA